MFPRLSRRTRLVPSVVPLSALRKSAGGGARSERHPLAYGGRVENSVRRSRGRDPVALRLGRVGEKRVGHAGGLRRTGDLAVRRQLQPVLGGTFRQRIGPP